MGIRLVLTRLAANGHLAGCNPNLNCAFLENSCVGAYPERVIDAHLARTPQTQQLRLRLTPIFQFVPRHRATTVKDFIGSARNGLLNPSRLFIFVYGDDLQLFAGPRVFPSCFYSHGVPPAYPSAPCRQTNPPPQRFLTDMIPVTLGRDVAHR